ncbi:MAG: ATP-grasp domain-containing protein [archaeon]|nr:ATP-grasp domain-containing protein [archaeon]
MSKKLNILITAIGSANGINALMGLRRVKDNNFNIIGVDSNSLSAGLKLVDKGYVIPSVKNKDEYLNTLYDIISKDSIDVVIPIFSKELPIFAQNKEKFFKKTGIKLCLPSSDLINQLNDKYTFFQFLVSNEILTPEAVFLKEIVDDPTKKFEYPYVIKDRLGAGSKSVWIINNSEDFRSFMKKQDSKIIDDNKFIIQKYIEGSEYTVDFCCDFNSNFLGAVIRERLEVRDGKCTKGKTIINKSIYNQVKKMLLSIKFIGPGNVQGILTADNEFYFIEMNPRFAAGGLPLTIEVGFNIPWILVQMISNSDFKYEEFDDYPSGKIMVRYFNEVFMDENK